MTVRLKVSAMLCAVLAAGCGGGGGGGGDRDDPPPAPPAHWRPALDTTWHWQLQGTVSTGHEVTAYDIDLFDTPVETIRELQKAGRKVVCYFSAGSSENWRADSGRFERADMGNNLDGWDGERWLDTRSENVRKIMLARLDLAAEKGCDGVEPDNVDGYTQRTGFALTAQTQLDYNRFLAREAHARGLAIGLKNDIGQLDELVDDFDFAVNEQCHEYNECDAYAVFIRKNKPVLNVEYANRYVNDRNERDALCADAKAKKLHTLVLPLALDDSFRYGCE